MTRGSGILLHVTSLPNKFGLGCMSREAYEFIDKLKQGGCKYWQVLPVGCVDYGESPYSPISAFAGNPYFIDLSEYLSAEELADIGFSEKTKKNYHAQQLKYNEALKRIYFKYKDKKDISSFTQKHKDWLLDYALYAELKLQNDNKWFYDFPKKLAFRDPKALGDFYKNNEDAVNAHIFGQYIFYDQWARLKTYANKQGIKIIGDLTVYIGLDSADVWSHPENFLLDKNLKPPFVSGASPDYFNSKGQKWGHPIFNFNEMEKDNYKFLVKRLTHLDNFFDIIRIDHFVGIIDYWQIPYANPDAKEGHFVKGPGIKLLNLYIKESKSELIVEDLGTVSQAVKDARDKFNFPGFKILQLGFKYKELTEHLPHTFNENCVAYIGNHDNDTFVGFLSKLKENKLNQVREYLKLSPSASMKTIVDQTIKLLYSSKADIVIFTPQDLLYQGSEYKMSKPGCPSKKSWKYQLNEQLDDKTIKPLKSMADAYKR